MEGEWEALIRVSPRETAANVFFVDSLLAATHDSVRELHYLLSLLLDAACQAMTMTLDDSIPAEITAQLREVGNRIFRPSAPSVNEEFIARYGDAFFADFVQGASAFPPAALTSLHALHSRLLHWKRALAAIITSVPSFDLPDPMLRPLAGCLRYVTLPAAIASHTPTLLRPLAVASSTPSLGSPAYQSRHFTVVTDAAASAPVRYGLRAMSAEQMVCSLQARTLEWCLDCLLEESAFAAQHLRCSGRGLLPVGARHVLVREGPAEQSLLTLAEALLREKGQDYDEALLAAVPSYAAWNGFSVASVAQQVPSPRSAVDFESLSRFMLG